MGGRFNNLFICYNGFIASPGRSISYQLDTFLFVQTDLFAGTRRSLFGDDLPPPAVFQYNPLEPWCCH
jgi:hypothetical protein